MSEQVELPPMGVIRRLSTLQAINARQRVFEVMNERARASIEARGILAERMKQVTSTEVAWWATDDVFQGLDILNAVVKASKEIGDPLAPFVTKKTVLRSDFAQFERTSIDEAAYAMYVNKVTLSRDMVALACMADGFGVVLVDNVVSLDQLGTPVIAGITIGLEVPIL